MEDRCIEQEALGAKSYLAFVGMTIVNEVVYKKKVRTCGRPF